MKFSVLLIYFFFLILNITAQNDLRPAVIYLENGNVIEGKMDDDFPIGPDLEVHVGKVKKNIAKTNIDSLFIDNTKYITEHKILANYFIKNIEEGIIDVYAINNRRLAISREGSQRYRIPEKQYGKAFNYFCRNRWDEKYSGMKKEEFIEQVAEYNSGEGPVNPVLYDSISTSSAPFLLRLSFYRPEAGFELKISDRLTLFNSLGVNISGFLRGAETFINYDYSNELRFYYNHKNRLVKGKDIYNFSGPFFAGTYKYFIENNIQNRHAIGLLHGWQENNLFRFLYSNIRLGLAYDVKDGDILILSFINLGWVF